MNLSQLIRDLEEMAVLLELDGANPFKVGAYPKASRALKGNADEVHAHLENGTLTEIEGIGKGIASKIEEYHATGKIEELEELRKKIPGGLVDMTRIPGFGAKKAKAVYKELGIDNLEDLGKACEDGTLAALKGFGEKTAENVVQGIRQLASYTGRHRLDSALMTAIPILEALRGQSDVLQAELAGSLRRRKETVGDLDFVVATKKPAAVMDFFVGMKGVTSILGKGETKASVMLHGATQADLRCVTETEFPYTLLHFTGSKEHNTRLRQLAKEQGLKLNEYGLFPEGKEKALPARSEADVYKHLGLAEIAPELREDMGEVEAAAEKRLPTLITRNDFRGMAHMHTTYSDGKPTPRLYAEWAVKQGISWMGIADHSRSLTVANGLSEERVLAQHKEIDAVNEEFAGKKVRLLKGIESDILQDGSLDYPTKFLANFEFIVASVHTHFNLTEKEQTARIIKAIENPHTTILGHPSGRLLLAREAYSCDLRAIIRAAAENGVAIEINANPWRLDLDWRLVHYAIEKGCRLSIGPDAHAMDGLEDIKYGLAMARKGWVEPDHLVNTMSTGEFLKFAAARK
ncbi:MAG: DNA polymerase/3'-5' exonuclease PolX [Candidatus Sumerlaeia bacterium]|nr:DNA polymerase/3'-5' exonuclease PolX [Candidatus Sumerlaeia bacterium]